MKAIYPWPEMNIGDVREVTTHRSKKAVYSAAWEWAKKHKNRNEDGSRPKFKVEIGGTSHYNGTSYLIERTA